MLAASTLVSPALAQTITLHGAVQFNDEHAFNKTLLKFEELVNKYYGKPVKFVLHRNSELGTEKDYFAYLSQGISVDYAVVSPSHMSTFAKSAPLMDMPFLFRDLDHWHKVLNGDALKPIADEVAKRADVLILGYAGGGIRNLIVNKPVRNMQELKGLNIRVMGAPVQTRMFQAITASPDPDRRDPGRGKRSGRARTDEILRSRAAHLADPARDHRAAGVFFRQNLPAPAERLAGRHRQGGT